MCVPYSYIRAAVGVFVIRVSDVASCFTVFTSVAKPCGTAVAFHVHTAVVLLVRGGNGFVLVREKKKDVAWSLSGGTNL